MDEPEVGREEHAEAIDTLEALVRAKYGLPPRAPEDSDSAGETDAAPADDASTQTGRRQNPKAKPVLTHEVKAFIVRGLARYETSTRVAASVKAQFGITIDRRQVYAYDPAGSRPPASESARRTPFGRGDAVARALPAGQTDASLRPCPFVRFSVPF